MKFDMAETILLSLVGAGSFFLPVATGHGLMEDPPSRNWICGVVTKPDHVLNGVALTPECGEAFEFEDGGYQFMSVLTHDVGRIGVDPLPNNVCGFDSESWFGGPTPWDAPMDWPTTPMSSGRNEIKWNIAWGNHYTDTEDFRYWITKPDFQFDPNRAVTWSDLEDEPFCELFYNDANPNGNPDIIPLYASTQFRTFCDVPEREGHHIIYGEWGRNSDTFERFHGCIDASFDGSTVPPGDGDDDAVRAVISYQLSNPTLEGEGTIGLDASASVGDNLSYSWSVTTEGDSSIYSIDNPTAVATTLTLGDPAAAQQFTIILTVANSEGSSTNDVQLFHYPSTPVSTWRDFGQLQPMTQDLALGTRISLLTVDSNGAEVSYPVSPLIVDDSNRAATNWPVVLSNALKTEGAPVAVGVLNTNTDEVIAQYSTTNNRVFGYIASGFTLVQLQLDSSPASGFPTSSPVEVTPTPTAAPISTAAPIANPAPIPTPAPIPNESDVCFINLRADSNNPWHGGLDVGFDVSSVILDFSNTGLDLSQVNPQAGVFTSLTVIENTQRIILTKPSWMSKSNPGYLGIGGNNVPALGTFTAPTCTIANIQV